MPLRFNHADRTSCGSDLTTWQAHPYLRSCSECLCSRWLLTCLSLDIILSPRLALSIMAPFDLDKGPRGEGQYRRFDMGNATCYVLFHGLPRQPRDIYEHPLTTRTTRRGPGRDSWAGGILICLSQTGRQPARIIRAVNQRASRMMRTQPSHPQRYTTSTEFQICLQYL
jgi:hypothetical protein